MCYNCGCKMPDDDMGKGHMAVDPEGKAITTKTFQTLAQKTGMTEDQVKKNVHNLLMEHDMKK